MENNELIVIDNSFDIEEFIKQQKERLSKEPTPDIDEMLKNTPDGKRGTGFAFTYNNFTHTPQEVMTLFQDLQNISFFRFQIEKAPDTGTIHYQGYIHFSKRIYWGQVRRLFIKMGLHRLSHRNRIATPQQAADYCFKSKSKLTETIYEWGELDNEQGKRTDLNIIIDRVKQGATNAELLDEFPTQFFRFSKHIETVRKTLREKEFEDKFRNMQVVYVYGSPRSGKTRHIMEKYGYKNVCRVTIYDKWLFENYKGQPVVLFDEFDGQPKITEMNDYIDGYPYLYRCRNEDRVAMNDKVFIISNLPLSSQYTKEQGEKPKVYEALCKRITHIINWDNDMEREHFIKNGTSLPPQTKLSQSQMEMIPIDDKDLPW